MIREMRKHTSQDHDGLEAIVELCGVLSTYHDHPLSEVGRLESDSARPAWRKGNVEFSLFMGSASTWLHDHHMIQVKVERMGAASRYGPFMNLVKGNCPKPIVWIPRLSIDLGCIDRHTVLIGAWDTDCNASERGRF
jgi:hypothetical protein